MAQSATSVPAESTAVAVSDMVPRILSYTRWPADKRTIQLCMIGEAASGRLVTGRPLTNGRTLIVQRLRADRDIPSAGCDAVYIGSLSASTRAAILAQLNDRAIASITDADPQCLYGAMVCLRTTPAGLTFDLNIDAVARSRVRIDPRLLSLARNAGSRP